MIKIGYIFLGLLGVAAFTGVGASEALGQQAFPQDAEMEAQIKKVLSKMTLEEKIGQMCELEIGQILSDSSNMFPHKVTLDAGKLKNAFGVYKVGSILNVPQGFAQTPEVWYQVINEVQKSSMKEIGIPDIYGVDQNHGASYTAGATLFPQEINMGASFNRSLVKRGAEICAYESRACGIPWVYNPVMDLGRNPVWPRIWESFGEDVYVNSELAKAMVAGYQGDDPNHLGPKHVASCLKHYMGYGVPVSGQDRTPSSINPTELREKFFQPYKEAIRAGALSVMVNSGVNNGLPFHVNHELLTVWLKDELGWDGMIVTDWADIHNIWKRDHAAADYKEAIKRSINAGIDMSMTPYDTEFCTLLKQLVEEGEVEMSRIDDAVSRILRLKMRLGLFKTPVTNPKDYPLFGCKEFADASLRLAVESEVLLKNGGVLPLAPGKKILVAGPNANSMRTLNGGWTYTWQGTDMGYFHDKYNTIYEAICNEYGKENVILEQGMDYDPANWRNENNIRIEDAVAASENVDVIVVCVGENSYTETPGNVNELKLSDNQTELVKALSKTGKPIVMVLNEGRPRIVREIAPLANAIIDVMLPGNYGGDALSLLLSGKENFSGRLPFTYPKFANAFAVYDRKPCEQVETMAGAYNYDANVDVEWNFGFGLSYTTYEYSNIRIDCSEFSPEDEITLTVDVRNTGSKAGMETVLLFSSDLVASQTPDVVRLRGFEKIDLPAGAEKTVSFKIPASDLAFVDYNGKWTLEKGEFRFQIGTETLKAKCTATKVWDTPNI